MKTSEESKKTAFGWSLFFSGLVVDHRLVHFGIPQPSCPFYNLKASNNFIGFVALPGLPGSGPQFSMASESALLGKKLPRTIEFDTTWQLNRIVVLFLIRKKRNVVLSNHAQADKTFSWAHSTLASANLSLQITIKV